MSLPRGELEHRFVCLPTHAAYPFVSHFAFKQASSVHSGATTLWKLCKCSGYSRGLGACLDCLHDLV